MTHLVACLTVTNRPRWIPWVNHQVSKQTYENTTHVVIDGSKYDSIGEARNAALASTQAKYVAWFDDDDWSHPDRIRRAMDWVMMGAGACGNLSSWLVDAKLGPKCSLIYPGYGYVIFNGAVFDRTKMPVRFTASSSGEDVQWVSSGAKRAPHVSIPELQHVWLCHGQNVVNRASLHVFDYPLPSDAAITAEERGLIP
jgi:glycosyltransferase involved in cell wall biosynthesis